MSGGGPRGGWGGRGSPTFFRTFMAKIFPVLVPCTLRTWNTWKDRQAGKVGDAMGEH